MYPHGSEAARHAVRAPAAARRAPPEPVRGSWRRGCCMLGTAKSRCPTLCRGLQLFQLEHAGGVCIHHQEAGCGRAINPHDARGQGPLDSGVLAAHAQHGASVCGDGGANPAGPRPRVCRCHWERGLHGQPRQNPGGLRRAVPAAGRGPAARGLQAEVHVRGAGGVRRRGQASADGAHGGPGTSGEAAARPVHPHLGRRGGARAA
mmetsp:Transcript_26440/g.49897  ORF Transcript_26440/g.49897 Transcript_26440/m.49897 type:complete len:205 (+) Transcript_26440:593-1207(+)